MPDNENEQNLEWLVNRHEAEFNAISKRITELENDLKIVIRFASGNIVYQARNEANRPQPGQWSGGPAPGAEFQEQCRKFAEKYSLDS